MKNRKVVFLTKFYTIDYGVSHFIQHISEGLELLGWEIHIITEIANGTLDEFRPNLHIVGPNLEAVRQELKTISPDLICAHTSPYFEMLPSLNDLAHTMAFEHGDPNPFFFDHDNHLREQIIDIKKRIYPQVSGVACVSEFIKSEIGVESARIIYAGGDHVSKKIKPREEIPLLINNRPLRICMMYRLGRQESKYKSEWAIKKLLNLKNLEIHVIGRGTQLDVDYYKTLGVLVHTDVSNEKRDELLKSSDCYLSTSLWEGFNSPLVEAQFLGVAGLAFDVGAHPEVTPHLLRNFEDFERYLNKWKTIPGTLLQDSELSRKFVSSRYRWEFTISKLDEFMTEVLSRRRHPFVSSKFRGNINIRGKRIRRLFKYQNQNGFRETVRKLGVVLKAELRNRDLLS